MMGGLTDLHCNQRFFGQEHFEAGTPERDWCKRLAVLKPAMSSYQFAMRDQLPSLPRDVGGVVEIKYNGMLTVLAWDDDRGGFVGWSPRGRCYYSLGGKRHPVAEYLSQRADRFKDYVLVGETHVVRESGGKRYMSEFSESMSIIKNPRRREDVERIQLAVFDYRRRNGPREFAQAEASYLDRFDVLRSFRLPVGVDKGPVHLPDYRKVEDFGRSQRVLQSFWDEYVGERGFEGFVIHTAQGDEYKVKFRDTLDVAILGFRTEGEDTPRCPQCGIKFGLMGLIELVREGRLPKEEWFGQGRRQKRSVRVGDRCPLCGSRTLASMGPILGAKIALMTPGGDFVDIADGAQISPLSPILWRIEPLYEEEGYLWVRPEVVIEVSYQDLYVDRARPVLRFTGDRYTQVGNMDAVCLRPYFKGVRDDKTVNTQDLRLEQVSYLVDRIHRIRETTRPSTKNDHG